MGHIRICGNSRSRVTARSHLANRGETPFTLYDSRHVYRQSHPFERLFPGFSAGVGTEMCLYPIESLVYHHARQTFVSQMIAQRSFFVCIEAPLNTLAKLA